MAGRAKSGEFETIERYFAPLSGAEQGAFGLSDDAAVLAPSPGTEFAMTLDTIVAGVHFFADDAAADVAAKLLRVNLSDLAAMGAAPRAYLLSCAWNDAVDDDWIAEFTASLAADQAAFGITLVGGDTVSTRGPLCLSLTAVGEVPAGRALRRDGARAGDDIYVSGTIGDAAAGLRLLTAKRSPEPEAELRRLIERYRRPQPRLALGRRLVGLASACIDVSDGLAADLAHIAETSGVGAEVRAADLPTSAAARSLLPLEALISGGDDYELLFTAAAAAAPAVAAIGRETGIAVCRIGTMTAGSGVAVVDADGRAISLARGGYRHF